MAEQFDRKFPDQYMLRLPAGLRETLKAAAGRNGRSLNVEIVTRLEASLATAERAETEDRLNKLEELVDALMKRKDEATREVFGSKADK